MLLFKDAYYTELNRKTEKNDYKCENKESKDWKQEVAQGEARLGCWLCSQSSRGGGSYTGASFTIVY